MVIAIYQFYSNVELMQIKLLPEVIFNTNLYRYEENMLRLIRPRITQINWINKNQY